jgi:carbonic anhydrase
VSRYLILVAVLVAGCEQLKSPERIQELESRVDKLSEEVAAMKAGSGSAGKPGGEPGAVAAAGSGSAEPAAAGSGSAADEAAPGAEQAAAQPPVDAGAADGGAGDPPDRALAALRAVVAGVAPGARQNPPDAGRAAPPAPAAPTGPPAWSYEGKRGPPTWGTLDPAWRACLMGKAQSPVDIEPRAGTASPITFHYKPTAATLVDEGHALQVQLAPGSTIEIDGHAYQLLQVHFHSPSEHTIAGERYPMELHLLHQDADGKIAVISVLYDAGAESKLLGEVWARWPRKVGGEDRLRRPFDPSGLLPETRTVFRYTGSLTTPPCTEGVMWNVMRRAMSDSKAHLDELARHYPHNAREVQPLGDRKIL